MADQHKCRVCGATLAGDAPPGHCPACLLKLGFPESLAANPPPEASSAESTDLPDHTFPRLFGDYELLELIGSGGMGIVYRARHPGLNRVVALKRVRGLDVASQRRLARFHLEARAAAQLDHPNIVPVYESGEHEGQPWFAMKLIEGGSLAQRMASGEFRVTNGAAAGARPPFELRHSSLVMAQVARAVHYAHQHGVLHRDLKPGNILLDRTGTPYLTDFGIAKLVQEEVDLTRTVEILGTPSYMAPEQAKGRPASVVSDVYSLGAILYELLTGKPPFEAATPMETMRRVAEEEPRRPTTFCPGIPRDLETICLKCLEKEPARRYPSALALAEDLERFLRNEPIAARPAAWHEKLWRWCRRKPALAAALGAFVLAVGVGFAGILWQWREAGAHARAERSQRIRAEEFAGQMQMDRAENFFEAGDSAAGLAWLAQVLRENPSNSVAAHRLTSALTWRSFPLPLAEFTNVTFAVWSPDGQRVATGSKDGGARVWTAVGGQPLNPPMWHTAKVARVQFSPDGRRVLTASDDQTARVWDAGSARPLTPALQHAGPVVWAEFSPDGRQVATASEDRTARVWDSASGAPVTSPLEHSSKLLGARFSPDGQTLLTAEDRTVRLWRATSGHRLATTFSHRGRLVGFSFSPNGQWLLTGSESGNAHVWDIGTGRELLGPMAHPRVVTSAEFSPEGQRVVTTCFDGHARVWDAGSAKVVMQSAQHRHWAKYAEFSPDGQRVVATSLDCSVRLWDAARNNCLSESINHERYVFRANFSPDGQRLLTSAADGITRVWDVRPGAAQPVTMEADRGLDGARFSPDGRRVVTAGWAGLARVWDAATGLPVTPELRHADTVLWAEFSPDGGRVTTSSRDGTACVWGAQTGQPAMPLIKHQRAVKRIRFSPDGERVVTASTDGTARVWNARTGEAITPPLAPHGDELSDAVFSPDGQRVVTACWDGAARVWDSRTGQLLLPPMKHEELVLFAEFTPDGQRIVTASNDGTGRFWDANTGQPVGPVLRHAGWVLAVRLSPPEGLAATPSMDFTARIWELGTGQLVNTVTHRRPVRDACFRPDGRWLATVSDDGNACVWDVRSGLAVCEPLRHPKYAGTALFSPDGRRLLTSSWDGVARVWDVPACSVPVPAWLPRLAEAVGGRRLNTLRQLEVVPVKEFLELKEQVEQSTATDPYTQWAKWFFADRSIRPQSPGSPVTVSDHVQRLLDKNTEASLRRALQVSPTNRAAFARLGGILRTNNPSVSRLAEAAWCERKAKEPAPH